MVLTNADRFDKPWNAKGWGMWVSQDTWDALIKRVEAVERWQKSYKPDGIIPNDSSNKYNLRHFDWSGDCYPPLPPARPLKDVVKMILDHLGLELFHSDGTPPATVLQKREPPHFATVGLTKNAGKVKKK